METGPQMKNLMEPIPSLFPIIRRRHQRLHLQTIRHAATQPIERTKNTSHGKNVLTFLNAENSVSGEYVEIHCWSYLRSSSYLCKSFRSCGCADYSPIWINTNLSRTLIQSNHCAWGIRHGHRHNSRDAVFSNRRRYFRTNVVLRNSACQRHRQYYQ